MRFFSVDKILAPVVALIILIAAAPAAGAATVKSNISKDTTWKARQSPYIVKADIMLEQGATLTIEKGVRVELAPDISIQVRGKLLALGTPEEPITFTSWKDEPWKNIYFTDFSPDAILSDAGDYVDGSIMRHCIVEKGYGIYVRFGSPLITECIIRDNVSSGIRVEFGAPKIIRNRIFGNSTLSESASGNGGGIIAYTDKPALIVGNIIHDNISHGGRDGGGGVYIYAADGAAIVMRDNLVYSNKSSRFGGGVYAYGGIIEGNRIIGNEADERGGGMYVVDSRVSGNLVQSNRAGRGGGVYAENSVLESNSIIRNASSGPEGGALYYFGSDSITANCMTGNTAGEDGGSGGIYVSGNPVIRANNVYNNSGYALRVANVSSAPEISAAENFWGAASQRAVLELAYDWLDSDTTGLADYTPFLNKMSPDAPVPPPCNLTARASGEGISLSWDKPGGTQAEGHKIYVGIDDGYPYEQIIVAGPESSHEIKGLTTGNEYRIAVSAYSVSSGEEVESGLSEQVRILLSGTPEFPTAPSNFSPVDNAKDAPPRLTLEASAPGIETAASRWQVSAVRDDFSSLVLDLTTSNSEGDLSSLDLDGNGLGLVGGQQYFWRTARRTSNGSWSDWSEATSFTMKADDPSLISGPIASALTLEKRLSPYTVTGNLLITSSGDVSIEPGVEILFAPGTNLMVRGKLAARGTEGEPIKFTRQGEQKWGRLIFSDQSADYALDENGEYESGCILENCVIEQGSGLLIEHSSPLIKNCEVAENNGSGITIRQGGPTRTGSDIHHNSAATNGGGVYAYTNDIIFITGNRIHNNRAEGDGGGVYAYGYMNTSTIRVADNEILDNTASVDGGGIYLSRSSAVGNRIESNVAGEKGGGIFATFGLVDTNELRGNKAEKGGGVFAERNSSLTENLVVSNNALSGFGGGIYIDFWGISIDNEVFTENTVTGNTAGGKDANGGVYIMGYLVFERNNIYDNAGSQLYNANEPGSNSLSVPDCYWGSADKNTISKQIVDGSDNPKLGMVSFEPFSTDPIKFD